MPTVSSTNYPLLKVHLRTTKGDGSATLQKKVWTRDDAMSLAKKWGFGTAAVLVATVFIPLVHLFTIPMLLFVPFLLGRFGFRMHLNKVELWGAVQCPACQQEEEVRWMFEQLPIHRDCSHCRTQREVKTWD